MSVGSPRKNSREAALLEEIQMRTARVVLEKDVWRDYGTGTPLHGLFAKFVDTACGNGNCIARKLINKEYYTYRCIRPLCFARWLVLKGYAKFNFKALQDSVKRTSKKKSQ